MRTLKSVIACLTFLIVAGSCKKDAVVPPPSTNPTNPKSTPYYVRMTDAPGNYSAVYIDLQSVEITGNGGNNVTLNTNPGIYNLLHFSNGYDTLIASGSLTTDKVEQIRLILGPNNSVVTSDGVSHPLKTPSAEQSGLKLQVHQTLQAGVAYEVLLDFDAAQSIVEKGNGDYSLKPVIRTIEIALSGSIRGKVSKAGVLTTVTATSGPDSYSSVVNAKGEFVIKGLPPGNYTLLISPVIPYNPATITNVNVTTGSGTDVGIIAI